MIHQYTASHLKIFFQFQMVRYFEFVTIKQCFIAKRWSFLSLLTKIIIWSISPHCQTLQFIYFPSSFILVWLDCLVICAVFNKFSVISRCFLGKLPVLLVHLFWHQTVSCNANPETLSAKEGSHYYHFLKSLVWPDRGSNPLSSTPEVDAPPLHHWGSSYLCEKYFFFLD